MVVDFDIAIHGIISGASYIARCVVVRNSIRLLSHQIPQWYKTRLL